MKLKKRVAKCIENYDMEVFIQEIIYQYGTTFGFEYANDLVRAATEQLNLLRYEEEWLNEALHL